MSYCPPGLFTVRPGAAAAADYWVLPALTGRPPAGFGCPDPGGPFC